ncbi:MAG TPA: cupin domain-containing protein [Microbacteriaceae bacterium]|nr:cupin domain-containing protein [Microbacteriaceae bacterium]
MPFDRVVTGAQADFPARTAGQGGFAYAKHQVIEKAGNQLQVSFMEIPPGRSAFPYHWHEAVTEAYVILAGQGRVRTPDAEFDVGPGQVVVFPPGPAGAHRITNTGDVPLRYVDLDTTDDPDVCHYPDSGKTARISSLGTTIWRDADATGYYDGEPDA